MNCGVEEVQSYPKVSPSLVLSYAELCLVPSECAEVLSGSLH